MLQLSDVIPNDVRRIIMETFAHIPYRISYRTQITFKSSNKSDNSST